jgi:predicted DNA-binding transcriptional regulator YafY
MSQRQQLERILEIDRRIRAGLYPNADTLAGDLEVSRRVIFTDRTFMMDRLGAPIAYDRKRCGWHYTDRTWVLPSVMVTEGELLTAILGVEAARRYLGTSLEPLLRSVTGKILTSLRGPVSVDLESLAASCTFSAPAVLGTGERILFDLHRAIKTRRRVLMRYFTASRRIWSERTVDPYHLRNVRGEWYLIAFDELRRNVRFFHIGRIASWTVLDGTFIVAPGFSLENWLGQAFQFERGNKPVKVAIRFDAVQAPYIRERAWHETQTIRDLPDGGLVIRFITGGIDEVKRWVLQYGRHAKVLEPRKLKMDVIAEIQAMRTGYLVTP